MVNGWRGPGTPAADLGTDVFQAILDSAEDGIFVLNRDEEVVVFNRACERLTGVRREEAIGTRLRCDEVFHCHRFGRREAAEEAALAPARAALSGRLPVIADGGLSCAILDIFRDRKSMAREELLLVSRSGERHWVETSFSPVCDETGAAAYTVGVLRIVDERKRAELEIQRKNAELERALAELKERTRELVQSEKMASIGQLAAGVAHELNTPLNTILGYSQLLGKQLAAARAEAGPLEAVLAEALEEVHSVEAATKRCRDIVRGLLDFSRKPESARAPRRLAKAVGRVFSFLKHDLERRGIAYELLLDRSDAAVLAEENQLEQVLLNLASNAIDAMPAGGRIVVRTRVEGEDPARFAVLTFSDTGPGIPPAFLGRVFEPFFTTKATGKGTGLGLSIAARIVEDHGGTISAANDPAGGAAFTIRLPVVPASPAGTAP